MSRHLPRDIQIPVLHLKSYLSICLESSDNELSYIHNYRLYNKWIKKTAITNETETYVELTSSLNEKQKDFLREHYKETLERIFGKKTKYRK